MARPQKTYSEEDKAAIKKAYKNARHKRAKEIVMLRT